MQSAINDAQLLRVLAPALLVFPPWPYVAVLVGVVLSGGVALALPWSYWRRRLGILGLLWGAGTGIVMSTKFIALLALLIPLYAPLDDFAAMIHAPSYNDLSQTNGAALKTGLAHAQYPIVMIIDADGTYPIECAPDIIRAMSQYDMVVGARIGPDSHVPLLRRPVKQIIDYMRTHPVETLKNLPQKAWYMWYTDVDGGRLNERNSVTATDSLRRFFFIFKLVSQTYYLCIIFLFLVATYFLSQPRHNRNILSLGVLIIVYFTCISLVFHGQTRFHFPVMPWIIIYASFAIERLLHQTNAFVHISRSE